MENLFPTFATLGNRGGFATALAATALLVLAGCATPATVEEPRVVSPPQAEQRAAPAPVARQLSADARRMLDAAEASVALAKAQAALWPRAATLLGEARTAALRFDDAAVRRFAEEADALARLGLAQKQYPLVSITLQP